MYYGAIKECDIANGTGCRVSLFVSGCTNHCKGCFQPETWDFEYGQKFTARTMTEILMKSNQPWISGLSILGGDPMHRRNLGCVMEIVRDYRSAFPGKTIWIYTGYTWDELLERKDGITMNILKHIDILVDGRFVEELKGISLKFRGSSNQRIIDVWNSLQNGKVELMDIKDRKIEKQ